MLLSKEIEMIFRWVLLVELKSSMPSQNCRYVLNLVISIVLIHSLLYPCDVNIIYILLVVILIFTFVYIEDMCKDMIYLFAYTKKSLFFNNKKRKKISIPYSCMLRVNKVLLFSLLRKKRKGFELIKACV